MNKILSVILIGASLGVASVCAGGKNSSRGGGRSTLVSVGPRLVTVRRIVDGDTFVTTKGERVRVAGLDTPEIHHPRIAPEAGGKEAKAFAESRLAGKTFSITPVAHDKYGRTVAKVPGYQKEAKEAGFDKRTPLTFRRYP